VDVIYAFLICITYYSKEQFTGQVKEEGSATQPCVFEHHPPNRLSGCLQNVLTKTLVELVKVLELGGQER